MSIPKADPGLAAFLKTLDPSMYTISGGPPEPPPTTSAEQVKGLREDMESRYRETQIRDDANLARLESENRINARSVLNSPLINAYAELGKEEIERRKKSEERYKREPGFLSFVKYLFGY